MTCEIAANSDCVNPATPLAPIALAALPNLPPPCSLCLSQYSGAIHASCPWCMARHLIAMRAPNQDHVERVLAKQRQESLLATVARAKGAPKADILMALATLDALPQTGSMPGLRTHLKAIACAYGATLKTTP